MSILKKLLNRDDEGSQDNTRSKSEVRDKQMNDILVSGGEFYGFKAKTSIEAGEAVKIIESDTVVPCENIDQMYGVALFDAAAGEDVSVVERPVTLRLKITEDVEAGNGVSLKTSTVWEKDNSQRERAIVMNSDDSGVGMIELRPVLS